VELDGVGHALSVTYTSATTDIQRIIGSHATNPMIRCASVDT